MGLTDLSKTNFGLGIIPNGVGSSGGSGTAPTGTGYVHVTAGVQDAAASAPATVRTDIGAAASGANSDITSLTALSTPLSIGQGGTGATTAAGAIANLGAVASVNTRTGAVTLVGTDIPVFVASGASHAVGAVPDPGVTAGATRFLREDATWTVPAGGGTIAGTAAATQIAYGSGANTITGNANFVYSGVSPSNNVGALLRTEAWGAGAGAALTTGALDNTLVGFNAGNALTTTSECTAVGSQALSGGASVGVRNNAFGRLALSAATLSGQRNSAFGWSSGLGITSGSFNCLYGHQSGAGITTGSANVCSGDGSGFSLTTQSGLVCIGDDAGRLMTAAFDGDVYLGYQAGNRQVGSFGKNIAIGYQAFSGSGTPANNTANGNTIIGYQAGTNISTGGSNSLVGVLCGKDLTTGSENIFIGPSAGLHVTTGGDNVALGSNAMAGNGTVAPTGSNNFAMGYYALARITTGHDNVAIGSTAGGGFSGGITTGNYNILLGTNAGDSTAGTVSGHFVAGANGATITDVFLGGNGETNATPTASILHRSTAGLGTDVVGSTVIWAPGAGTGAGAGGAFVVQTAPAGTTGAVAGTLVERFRIAPTGIVTIGTIGATFAGNVVAGVQTGLAAVSGQVGEIISATNSAYTNAAATGTYGQITSVLLTPGDWDISGFVTLSANGATLTVTANSIAAISTTTASAAGTTEGAGDIAYVSQVINATSGRDSFVLRKQVNIAVSTTYFLNAQSTYTLGNPQFVGSLVARRLR